MTKAFHIADTHIEMGPRWDECRRVLTHFADRVEKEKPDLVIHAGDVFNKRSSPKEMEFAERWFQCLANTCPVVIVGGNHDDYTELKGFERLSAKNKVLVFTRPDIAHVAGLSLVCVPWPTLSGVMQDAADMAEAGTSALDHLRAIFSRLGSAPSVGHPKLGVMHAMVTGVKTAAGQPLRNCDFSLGMEDLEFLNCPCIALGHIHNWQKRENSNLYIDYCGSPFHTDWGDWVNKSFTVWEYGNHGITLADKVPLPAHQMIDVPMEFLPSNCSLTIVDDGRCGIADSFGEYDDYSDQELRLSYSFNPENASAAHESARNWERKLRQFGAADVKLNPTVIVSTAARVPEVTTAVSPEEKLKAYMRSRGEDPDTEDNQRVLSKFATLVQGNNETTEN